MEAMSERLLGVGDGLIVAFPVGSTKVRYRESEESEKSITKKVGTSRLFFFKVSGYAPFLYNWNKLGALSKDQSSGLDYLGDAGHGEGSDILRVEVDDFHVYHAFLAPQDTKLRIYRSISPVGDPLSALSRKTVSEVSVEDGTEADSYTLKDIGNKFDPSVISENLIFRAGSSSDGKNFFWGFYAMDDIPDEYTIYIRGRSYKLIPIVGEKHQREMLKISRLRAGQQPYKVITTMVGGLLRTGFTLSEFIPEEWENAGNYMDYSPERIIEREKEEKKEEKPEIREKIEERVS